MRSEHLLHGERDAARLDVREGRALLAAGQDRDEAIGRTLEGVDFSAEVEAHFIIWPGINGYDYPFQTYADSWARFVARIRRAQRLEERGVTIFLEHKNSEPAMKILMVERSVLQWRFIDSAAARIDEAALAAAQPEKDAVRAYELVYAAPGA